MTSLTHSPTLLSLARTPPRARSLSHPLTPSLHHCLSSALSPIHPSPCSAWPLLSADRVAMPIGAFLCDAVAAFPRRQAVRTNGATELTAAAARTHHCPAVVAAVHPLPSPGTAQAAAGGDRANLSPAHREVLQVLCATGCNKCNLWNHRSQHRPYTAQAVHITCSTQHRPYTAQAGRVTASLRR